MNNLPQLPEKMCLTFDAPAKKTLQVKFLLYEFDLGENGENHPLKCTMPSLSSSPPSKTTPEDKSL